MDALIRWADSKIGRRALLAEELELTPPAITKMLDKALYLPTHHIETVHHLTGVPVELLVRRRGAGLTPKEMEDLDAIARKREIADLEKTIHDREKQLAKIEINPGEKT